MSAVALSSERLLRFGIARRSDLAAVVERVVLAGIGALPVTLIAATAFRVGFIAVGLVQHDPIRHIGAALHLRPVWVVGYTWRYVGNGGGLAVAFFALGLRGVRAGALYGLAVCTGLLVTLAVSPDGQALLFPLNPATVVMATGGHLIYGTVLGRLAATHR